MDETTPPATGVDALPDPPEHLPRHLVGVAGGGGHEDDEVGHLEQPKRTLSILRLDAVEVGRVDQHQAAARGGIGPQLQPRVLGHGRDPSARVVGMEHGNRPPGGRAQDAGWADGGAGERVQQARLAAAGGAEDDDQQRCVEIGRTRQQVLGDMAPQRVGPGLAFLAGRARNPPGERIREARQRIGRRPSMLVVLHVALTVHVPGRACHPDSAAVPASASWPGARPGARAGRGRWRTRASTRPSG